MAAWNVYLRGAGAAYGSVCAGCGLLFEFEATPLVTRARSDNGRDA